jgi:hypothetical protein
MLDRPPPKARRSSTATSLPIAGKDGIPERKRDRKRLAMRRYRAREREGKIVVPIEVDAAIIDLLVIKTEWLRDRDAADRAAIQRALQLMIDDAAR